MSEVTFIIDAGELETFQQCLNSADSLNTPLSPEAYCEAKRLLSPHLQWDWGRDIGVSLGPPPGLFPQPGSQVFEEPIGPYQDEPEPVTLPLPTGGNAVISVSAHDAESLPGFAGWNIPGVEFLRFIGGKLQKFLVEQTTTEEVEPVGWITDLTDAIVQVAPLFNDSGGMTTQPILNYDASDPQVVTNGGSGGPGAPVTFANCGPTASPVWKKVCGEYKWVYPKRRRRRQLLTNRDYNDLLKLQTLKVNNNMTAAISKALTR